MKSVNASNSENTNLLDNLHKGDIVLMRLPIVNGREQSGLRPMVILSKETSGMVAIVPLTTKSAALKFPSTINVMKSNTNGLESDSIALIFQLRAIDKRRIKNKLGKLEEEYLLKINKKIKEFLEIK